MEPVYESSDEEKIFPVSASFVDVPKVKENFVEHDSNTITITKDEFIDNTNAYSDLFPILEGHSNYLKNNSIDEEFIKEVISADEIFRGRNGHGVGWPLMEESDLFKFILEYRKRAIDVSMPFVNSMRRTPNLYENFNNVPHPDFIKEQLSHKFLPTINRVLMMGNGNIVLAGGAVTNILRENTGYYCINDFDFFFVGFRPEETDKATSLLEHVVTNLEYDCRRAYDDNRELFIDEFKDYYYISRSENVLNVKVSYVNNNPRTGDQYINRIDLQFILRLYPDTGNVLTNVSLPIGGFDLYSCAVAYYVHEGEETGKFYATPAGAFAIACDVNILNTGRNSPSMMTRLLKYQSRNFRILLPGTSIEKVMGHYPHNILQKRSGGKFMNVKLPNYSLGCVGGKLGPPHENSDYSQQGGDGSIFYINPSCIFKGKAEHYLVAGSTYSKVINSKKANGISENFIENMFMDLVNNHNIDDMEGFYIERRSLTNTFGHFLKCKGVEDVKDNINELMGLNNTKFQTYCDGIFDEFVTFVQVSEKRQREKLLKGIHWNTQNPLTQHTASFNPTITDPRSWWGEENYVSFRVGFPDEMFFVLKILFTSGRYSNVGFNTLKNVLMPYFARAWATGLCEKHYSPATKRYNINAQYFYADRLAHKLIHSFPSENISDSDIIPESMISEEGLITRISITKEKPPTSTARKKLTYRENE